MIHTLPLNTPFNAEDPLSIGVTSRMLGVSSQTLRLWERKGLIRPSRRGKDRFYSQQDMAQLRTVKTLLRDQKLNIEGVKRLWAQKPCWEIKKCREEKRKVCSVFQEGKLKVNNTEFSCC